MDGDSIHERNKAGVIQSSVVNSCFDTGPRGKCAGENFEIRCLKTTYRKIRSMNNSINNDAFQYFYILV